jgi:2-methylcitrate dehydratase PrpD
VHACSRWCHAPIEATAALLARTPFAPDAAERITVYHPTIRALTRRVTMREEQAFTAMLPGVRTARVEARLQTGETLAETVKRPQGGFDNARRRPSWWRNSAGWPA